MALVHGSSPELLLILKPPILSASILQMGVKAKDPHLFVQNTNLYGITIDGSNLTACCTNSSKHCNNAIRALSKLDCQKRPVVPPCSSNWVNPFTATSFAGFLSTIVNLQNIKISNFLVQVNSYFVNAKCLKSASDLSK